MKYSVAQKMSLIAIDVYQQVASPDQGLLRNTRRIDPVCVFYPSCSDYAKETIKKNGVTKGIALTLKRIARCHPWQKQRIDLP